MHGRSRISRRDFLRRSAAGAAVIGAGTLVGFGGYEKVRASRGSAGPKAALTPGATASPGPTATAVPQRYTALHSRPDLNSAPTMHISQRSGTPAPGYIFLTPSAPTPQGCAIFDTAGHLVWYRPGTTADTLNFKVARFQGKDVLTWFEGEVDNSGTGRGSYVLFDSRYQPLESVVGTGGTPLDLHEFQITAHDTALVEFYEPLTDDLSVIGGVPGTKVLNCVIQEIDLASGKALFEWRSLDHVAMTESVMPPPTDDSKTFDYFHINSIEVDTDNNLIISARNTSALYKLNRTTGNVMWRLRGGDIPQVPDPRLQLVPSAETFWFQHDARRNADGTLSIFDDGGGPFHHNGRGLVMHLDETVGTALVTKDYGSALGQHVNYQGSFRVLPNGNTFVGWGDIGRVTEFNPDGSICLDATFSGNSYRALRSAWTATPAELPALAVARDGSGAQTWASWNGSTEVRQWRVLGGTDASSMHVLGVEPWQDFETAIAVHESAATYAVEALDAGGKTLARSAPVPLV